MTYRSKIAKIVPIENPRCPPRLPSLKFISNLFFLTGRSNDLKLSWKYQVDSFKLQSWGKKWSHIRGHLFGTQVSDAGPSLPIFFP